VTQPAGIDLNLNAQQYLQGSVNVLQQTGAMEQSLSRLAVATNVLNRSLDGASFSKKHSAALGTFAAAAATGQQQMSGLAATSAVTGESTTKLSAGVRQLARDFPTGTATALDTVTAINQLGIASKGSEDKVLSLSKTMIQLQGAAGGYAADYAPGMLQLERTFGDQGVDPRKVQATADALVSVSKNVGASVSGTLAFANAIGPVAQSAGVGKLATIGIGAAMTSIGQDSGAAGTAVVKMLTDMSSAVRDGGPQMNTYANIVGTSADNFKALFKNNPTAAIEEVTSAIGKAGQQGPRILQNLGLDGVRTFRSLQALSASGGLTNAINQSIAAGQGGGNGATAKASGASFNNVLDQFSEVSTSAGQVAQALGRPMLGALGLFAKGLSGAAKGVAGLMDNHIVKDAVNVLGGLLVARRVFGLGLTGAIAKQGLTSGPVLSGLAGWRSGRGDVLDSRGRLGGFGGKGAGAMETAANEVWINPATGKSEIDPRTGEERTVLNQGAMGGVRGRIYDFSRSAGEQSAARRVTRQAQQVRTQGAYLSRTYGPQSQELQQFQADRAAGVPMPRTSLLTRARGVIGTAAHAYMNINQASFDAAQAPVLGQMDAQGQPIPGTSRAERITAAMSTTGGTTKELASARWGQFTSRITGGDKDKADARAVDATKAWTKEIDSGAGSMKSLTRAMVSLGSSTGKFGLSTAGSAIGGTLKATASGIGSLAGMLLSPQGLLMGGMAVGGFLLNRSRQSGAAAKAESARTDAYSPTSFLDSYNEALGKAAQSTQTFAQQMDANAKLTSTAVTTFAQALTVNTTTKAASAGGKNVVTYDPNATNQQLESAIRSQSVNGMTPAQLGVVRNDLIRQFPSRAQTILGQLGPSIQQTASAAASPQGMNSDLTSNVLEAGGTNLNIPIGIHNPEGTANSGPSGGTNTIGPGNYYGWGSSTGKVTLKGSATQLNDTTAQNVQQRYLAQMNTFGQKYASQTAAGDINTLMGTAVDTGNEAEVDKLGKQLEKTFGFGGKGEPSVPRITSTAITKYGSFTGALAAKSPAFAAYLKSQGLNAAGQGNAQAIPQLNALAQRFTAGDLGTKTASPLMPLFDNTMTSSYMGTGSPNAPAQLRAPAPGKAQIPATPGGLEGLPGGWAKEYSKQVMAGPNKMIQQANAIMQQSIAAPDSATLQDVAQNKAASTMLAPQGMNMSFSAATSSLSKMAGVINDDTDPAFQRLIGTLARMSQIAAATAPFKSSGAGFADQMDIATAQVSMPGNSAAAIASHQQGTAGGTAAVAQWEAQVKQNLMAEHSYQVQSLRAQQDYQLQASYSQTDYLRQKGIAERDYNVQASRAEADYNRSRLTATRDFNKEIAREISDAAETMYDPYKRIQTAATWDVQSLLANMAEQNAAVLKQSAQLAQLRKMGLSEATIEQLKLNDPANAQQLNQITGDVKNKPSEIGQLNAQSAVSIKNAAALVNDPSNKTLTRAKADFATQLSDMEYNYKTAATRAKADIERTTTDMAHDYGVAMSRSYTAYQTAQFRLRQDTTDSERELVMTLAQTYNAAQDLMAGKYVAVGNYMQSNLKDYQTWFNDPKNNYGSMVLGWIGDPTNAAGITITTKMTTAFTPDNMDVPSTAGATTSEESSGSATNSAPAPKAKAKPTPAKTNTMVGGAAGGRSSYHGSYAGGIFTSPQLRYIGELGSEAVIPLSGQGVSMLAEAFSRAQISTSQINRMNTQGHQSPVQYVHHTETHITDHSTNYSGAQFTVQSNDPDDMHRKLEAKERAAKLVSNGKRHRP
jgi:hypothetical protein